MTNVRCDIFGFCLPAIPASRIRSGSLLFAFRGKVIYCFAMDDEMLQLNLLALLSEHSILRSLIVLSNHEGYHFTPLSLHSPLLVLTDFFLAILQRVLSASVTVDKQLVSSIGKGILVFAAVAPGDTEKDAESLAAKVLKMRLWDDENGGRV